jgi:hypothetical protein
VKYGRLYFNIAAHFGYSCSRFWCVTLVSFNRDPDPLKLSLIRARQFHFYSSICCSLTMFYWPFSPWGEIGWLTFSCQLFHLQSNPPLGNSHNRSSFNFCFCLRRRSSQCRRIPKNIRVTLYVQLPVRIDRENTTDHMGMHGENWFHIMIVSDKH